MSALLRARLALAAARPLLSVARPQVAAAAMRPSSAALMMKSQTSIRAYSSAHDDESFEEFTARYVNNPIVHIYLLIFQYSILFFIYIQFSLLTTGIFLFFVFLVLKRSLKMLTIFMRFSVS